MARKLSSQRARCATRSARQGRNQILKALEQSQWVIPGPKGAAARLGIKRSTLQFRMRKLGIRIARTGA
jgi:transcriptional regulator with GAF, ATPase, and Fis domain